MSTLFRSRGLSGGGAREGSGAKKKRHDRANSDAEKWFALCHLKIPYVPERKSPMVAVFGVKPKTAPFLDSTQVYESGAT